MTKTFHLSGPLRKVKEQTYSRDARNKQLTEAEAEVVVFPAGLFMSGALIWVELN